MAGNGQVRIRVRLLILGYLLYSLPALPVDIYKHIDRRMSGVYAIYKGTALLPVRTGKAVRYLKNKGLFPYPSPYLEVYRPVRKERINNILTL